MLNKKNKNLMKRHVDNNFKKIKKHLYFFYFKFWFRNEQISDFFFLKNYILTTCHSIIPMLVKTNDLINKKIKFKLTFYFFISNIEKIYKNRFFSLKLIRYTKKYYSNDYKNSILLVKNRFYLDLYKDKGEFF